MKKYKIVDPLPTQSAGMGFVAGASMGATSPASSLIAGGIGAGIGLIGGAIASRRDAAKQKDAIGGYEKSKKSWENFDKKKPAVTAGGMGRRGHMNDSAAKARR